MNWNGNVIWRNFRHYVGASDVVNMITFAATIVVKISSNDVSLQWRHNERDGVSFVQAQIKENMKAPRHWPLWGEFIGSRWIPRTKGR